MRGELDGVPADRARRARHRQRTARRGLQPVQDAAKAPARLDGGRLVLVP
ncbi:hypothetical protein ACIQNT_16300 [Streptomyces luteogriseus]|uniref:Uncharacterized protein n=1 Tax=Streptomyces luteogriseus TaxID=68233 RepID=A0A7W7DP79_9ACTN|nr:hypothetical protein [Streptomyces luteogriseus]MBB4713430.1 hypothetical protein [Streptomyces luteogriseus]